MRTVEERLKSYEPLWENWTYTGEFLGEGAMSSVFEIESTAMGFREVAALKIITVKKNMRGVVEIPENTLNEIKILRTLSGCPNIVNYHDSTQRHIYDVNNVLSEIDILIKMEKLKPLCEGDTLSENEVIKLGKDMCNALIHACEHGIIHRDIKPQNIFVDGEGNYKLGDFGIAKIVSEFSGHYTMNIGTLAYTAPEVHMNTTGVYDISSDIYSLGLVLYIFLNNSCLPFVSGSDSLHTAITKRLSGASFPSPLNGSKSLKTIVMRACNADVSKRYKTPQEMLEDLELLSTGGKKLVVDPFATLDANIDVEFETGSYTARGLTSTIRKPEMDVTPVGSGDVPVINKTEKTEGSRLKINMRSKASSPSLVDTPSLKKDETPVPATTVKPSATPEDKPTGSRLKTTMRSKASAPAPAADVSKPDDNKDSAFFSPPDSM